MSTPAKTDGPHRLRQHVHFLKVDETIQAGLVPFVGESHVFEQQRHEGHDGRLQFAHADPVSPVIPTRVDQRLELGVEFAEFRRQLLPG